MAEPGQSPMAARGLARTMAHFWMMLGVIIVAFPIYYVFIASTHSVQTILRPPLPLLPGPEAAENYSDAFSGGIGRIGGVSLNVSVDEMAHVRLVRLDVQFFARMLFDGSARVAVKLDIFAQRGDFGLGIARLLKVIRQIGIGAHK